jgi:hypothetical protein
LPDAHAGATVIAAMIDRALSLLAILALLGLLALWIAWGSESAARQPAYWHAHPAQVQQNDYDPNW